jgi:hypothetical protein
MLRIVNRARGIAKVQFSTLAKTDVAATPSTKPVPTTVAVKSGGSSFFQRLSSFFAGLGVGFSISTYFLYNELEDSNKKFAQYIEKLKAAAQQ